MFWRFLKTSIAVTLSVVPLAIAEIENQNQRVVWITILGVVVFAINFFGFFKPDKRFESVRDPTLKRIFDEKFSTVRRALNKTQRLPFRVSVMVPIGCWPFRKLKMIYTYEIKPDDPDYHMQLQQGHGLAWLVMENGKTGWFHREKHSSSELGLTDLEIEKTEHIIAIISLPLRRKKKQKPFAVLNIDALQTEAADFLEREFEELKNHNNLELQLLAEQVRDFV
ncbi:MAG: hypothetical protein HUJ26_08550 [Planctomycetaceae bacterium]|nr:hypothetical protein [Planctomycetaceae bacterium]